MTMTSFLGSVSSPSFSPLYYHRALGLNPSLPFSIGSVLAVPIQFHKFVGRFIIIWVSCFGWVSFLSLLEIVTGWCLLETILCLIPRTIVTSLSASKDTRYKTHSLCAIPGVPFWMCQETHKFRARWQASSSVIRADVTVVLEVRQSI